MKNNNLRIGLSMRITEANGYVELRDSIPRDWFKYLMSVFPEAQWLYLPNIGSSVSEYAEKWQLNSFIITGGENIGESPERDLTEFTLFDYAMKNNFPLLGVCRGLQIIYHKMGGEIDVKPNNFSNIHKAKTHSILSEEKIRIVNSYHENRLDNKSLPKDLNIFATCIEDNSIEAVSGNNLLGIMWHPERDEIINNIDAKIINEFFYRNHY